MSFIYHINSDGRINSFTLSLETPRVWAFVVLIILDIDDSSSLKTLLFMANQICQQIYLGRDIHTLLKMGLLLKEY
jgi:hypothetical protein